MCRWTLYLGESLLLNNGQEVLEACTGYLVKAGCLEVLCEPPWRMGSEGFLRLSLCRLIRRSTQGLDLVSGVQWVWERLLQSLTLIIAKW